MDPRVDRSETGCAASSNEDEAGSTSRGNAYDRLFETGIAHLHRYATMHGSSSPPRGATIDGFAIGQWVVNRRAEYRRGHLSAERILLEVGDGSAFASAAHLAAYAGIAPVTHRSGSSIRGEHPARSGNRKLKRVLFLSAFAALHDPTSRAYYDRKRAEGKKHNAALICLARRRCDVLYAMLKNKTFYRTPAAAPA
ncbi:transposase [Gordonia paraffinivorans]|uniref:transposase n=1 Tax=Gordonia paraffinivorans TaxID=175628 RepID=UPI001444AAA8|nr:transposase [Gordonia paraffinivorans]